MYLFISAGSVVKVQQLRSCGKVVDLQLLLAGVDGELRENPSLGIAELARTAHGAFEIHPFKSRIREGGEGRASPFIDCGDEVLVLADAALVVGNDLHDFLGFQHCKLSCTDLTVLGIRLWSATTFDREL